MASQHPSLERFVTLSPIPGFRNWLDRALQQRRDGVSDIAEDGQTNSLRLQPADLNNLQLLYPASRDGYVALQQLLAEMFDDSDSGESLDINVERRLRHHGDIFHSSLSSCSSISYLLPVSTAEGAAAPCTERDEVAAANSRGATRQREMVAVCKPILVQLCGVYLLKERRRQLRQTQASTVSTNVSSRVGTRIALSSLLLSSKV